MSKTYTIMDPSQSTATFAQIFNDGKDMDAWLSLYEPDAILLGGTQPAKGHEAIRQALSAQLGNAPGKITTRVNFHEVNGDIALTRSDYQLVHEGKVLMEASAVEVLRRQEDGRWLYIIDNPVGASVPSLFASQAE
jgi:ketosteroid isomerase-like protein